MGIYLSDKNHDCLTNIRFADDVLLFASSKEQLQTILCEFKKSTEKVGQTKILSNQSSDTRKEIEVDNVKVERLTRGQSARHLGQMITFQQQETTEIRNRIRAAWATFHKYRRELTSKKLPAQTSTRATRRSDNSDDALRIGNMDKSTRE